MRSITNEAMKTPTPKILAATAAMVVVAGAGCSPHVSQNASGLNIRTVPFGPTVQIGGVDDDDDTPVSVNVARRPGQSVVKVSED
ncbi:MAG: hypothetical protein FGM15_08610 [Chthoniobacterales bacterium]|nr:hypothetical protein [Chthoniobacterales bacterium]